jgi:hypothetical protein
MVLLHLQDEHQIGSSSGPEPPSIAAGPPQGRHVTFNAPTPTTSKAGRSMAATAAHNSFRNVNTPGRSGAPTPRRSGAPTPRHGSPSVPITPRPGWGASVPITPRPGSGGTLQTRDQMRPANDPNTNAVVGSSSYVRGANPLPATEVGVKSGWVRFKAVMASFKPANIREFDEMFDPLALLVLFVFSAGTCECPHNSCASMYSLPKSWCARGVHVPPPSHVIAGVV